MTEDLLRTVPQRRWNPLRREWVLVSPHRALRPWQGKIEATEPEVRLPYDPDCYLCPGNERANGERNPQYESTFVFQNDYSALLPETPAVSCDLEGIIVARSERGYCRVGCFTPRHDVSVAQMSEQEVHRVVRMWTDETGQAQQLGWVQHLQIFENRGALMGASNPHPHCQIWANENVPGESLKECAAFRDYRAEKSSCLLCDYAALELRLGERLVYENSDFVAQVPYWAVWPFELLVLSKEHCGLLTELNEAQQASLTAILRQIAMLYDRVFDVPFPYSMGLHQRPLGEGRHRDFHFHVHYYPPLLRSATIQKFMVGYELLAEAQRDITPEAAAERLRGLAQK